jgi:hypothetical protein
MNFQGHLGGGIVAAGATLVATTYCGTPVNPIALGGITVFFSLFPDLDIGSIPQRWFYRVIFGVMCMLFFTDHVRYSALLGIVSLVPLLHKHRGFMHWRTVSILFPILIAYIIDIEVGNSFANFAALKNYGIYILGAIIGWWTHLALDKKLIG